MAWAEYNRHGEEPLAEYLGSYGLERGYLIRFSFNQKKVVGTREVVCGGKTIVETIV